MNHFTPPTGWMNDPNGLIFHKGKYHLFYQHNPLANDFGNISWGHAVSEDLCNWEHWPVALPASEDKMIFSGCVVFDTHNSFTHPKGPSLVAIYTEHLYESETEYEQKIAYATSHDEGRTWDMSHPERLSHPRSKDFRDPKVFWYESRQKWIMLVALSLEYTIEFYESSDLKNWSKTGSFTADEPKHHSWECPDLFPLTDEHGTAHWVLTLSGDHHDGQGWGMFYFIGDFDGKAFITPRSESSSSNSEGLVGSGSEGTEEGSGSERTANSASGSSSRDPEGGGRESRSESSAGDSEHLQHQWLNLGHDFYAGITFEGMEERIMIAWCGNWAYAQDLPEHGIPAKMSLPRALSLKKGKLCQELIKPPEPTSVPLWNGPVTKIMDFEFNNAFGDPIQIQIGQESVKLDRSESRLFMKHPTYQNLNYRLEIDHAIVHFSQGILEVILNRGEYTLTEQC